MKQIIAFIRPTKEEAVCEALHAIPGVTGASFTPIRGFGRGKHDHSRREFDTAVVGSSPHLRLDIMVSSLVADQVVRAIVDTAHTGNRGDGKVYILSLENAARISTKEFGAAAV
jgi:nitrogen regulatory protein PII